MMFLNSSPSGRPELNCCSGSVLLPQDSSSLATRELAAVLLRLIPRRESCSGKE